MNRFTVENTRFPGTGFDVRDHVEAASAPFEDRKTAAATANLLNNGTVDRPLGWLYDNGKIVMKYPNGEELVLMGPKDDNDKDEQWL